MVIFKNHLTLVQMCENSIFYLVQDDCSWKILEAFPMTVIEDQPQPGWPLGGVWSSIRAEPRDMFSISQLLTTRSQDMSDLELLARPSNCGGRSGKLMCLQKGHQDVPASFSSLHDCFTASVLTWRRAKMGSDHQSNMFPIPVHRECNGPKSVIYIYIYMHNYAYIHR